jgi:hypothetical protein
MGTVYGVAPNESDWYYCAIVSDRFGETDYFDGYAYGEMPTRDTWQATMECDPHVWVAGMMHVHTEDLATVAAIRAVTCESCDLAYGDTWRPSFAVIEFTAEVTSSSRTYAHVPTVRTD